jgi:hypothetical protein
VDVEILAKLLEEGLGRRLKERRGAFLNRTGFPGGVLA